MGFWTIFWLHQLSTSKSVVILSVKDYEELATNSFQVGPRIQTSHALNFSNPEPADFLHIELQLDCPRNVTDAGGVQVGVSRSIHHGQEPYSPTDGSGYPHLGSNEDTSRFTWIMRFDTIDCYDIRHCVFFVVARAPGKCEGDLRVKRGLRLRSKNMELFQMKPLYQMERLFEHYPQTTELSIQIRIRANGYWNVDFSWGYSLHTLQNEGFGDSTISVNADSNVGGSNRLLIWFHTPVQYDSPDVKIVSILG